MKRRYFMAAAAAASTSIFLPATARASAPPAAVQDAIKTFGALSGTTSCLVACQGPGGRSWTEGHDPERVLFVGSAVKTFILATCLQAVEQGRLSEDEPWTVDDTVRSVGSPVFLNLSGTTPARNVLEAMIAHSDNTATDIALGKAGVAKVRALIAKAGLPHTVIPDSTRRLFSYLAGAPSGVDLGWAGMQRIQTGWQPGPSRSPVNGEESMLSTATEMVSWYEQALAGRVFDKPETLTEFKRIQAMADAIPQIVPSGIAAYAKGGSIEWDGFHCFCVPGQMIVDTTPVTFCFTINWTGPDEGVPKMFHGFRDAVAGVLKATVAALRASTIGRLG